MAQKKSTSGKKHIQERFKTEIAAQLQKDLGLRNPYQVPKLDKIVINVGLGDAATSDKALESGIEEIRQITGQQPRKTRAKKSIAGFKVRENTIVGAMVTLRGERMYDFFAKLTDIVFPRIRDFRGFHEKGFDGRGNYNIGLKDQLVFPEIDYDKVHRARGMNITVVTTAKTDAEAQALLKAMGFPFRIVKQQQSKTASQEEAA